MQPDTTLVLGDFQFAAQEIPENIPTGGEQRLSIKDLPGGVRVVDAMGAFERPLEWSGLFFGATALERSRGLDALRKSGLVQNLTWSQYNYNVIVREFAADHRRQFEIPYRIVCEVVQDLTTPASSPGTPPIDDAIADDADTASGLAGLIGDGTVLNLINGLTSAVGAVASFSHASNSTLNSVQRPLAAATAGVAELTAQTNADVVESSFGGVVPFGSSAQLTGSLTEQTSNMQRLQNLASLGSVLGRMTNNLGSINASQRTIATAGGNLFKIAQQVYGDPTAWTGIAKANGLTDPYLAGPELIVIPPEGDQSDGVLDA